MSELSTNLPTAVFGLGVCAVNNKVYLFGGDKTVVTSFSSVSTIYSFDSETETISTLSNTLPTAASFISTAVVGTKIYLFGGQNSQSSENYYGGTRLSSINLFSTAFDLPTDNLLLHLSSTDNLFKLINADTASIEVGLQGVYRGNADGVGEMETAYLHDGTDWVEV